MSLPSVVFSGIAIDGLIKNFHIYTIRSDLLALTIVIHINNP